MRAVRTYVRVGFAFGALPLVSCGGKSIAIVGYGPDAGGSGGTESSSAGTSSAGTSTIVTNSSGVDGLGCPGVVLEPGESEAVAATACAALTTECVGGLPVDLHLLVEASSRMLETIDGVSKWELVRRGVAGFLTQVAPHHRVGLRVFGATDGAASDCDPLTYAPPLVAPAHDSTTFAAIEDALATLEPSGSAPTVPALTGTLREIERIQKETRDGQRVVLVLGGAPSACGGTPAALEATFASSPVTSYVVALAPDFDVGPVGEETETWPFLIESGHESSRLTDSLLHIAAGATRQVCGFGRNVPADPDVLPERTRAFFDGKEIPRLAGPADCASSDNGGFYLTESEGRLEYRSCSCTCALFTTCETAEWTFFCE